MIRNLHVMLGIPADVLIKPTKNSPVMGNTTRLSKFDCITASFIINNVAIISLYLKTNKHLMRTINS
ncbi:hypothetical protein XBJ2_1300088 [Xenorhabdus bovienii str. Jollieti]|uniref:Uncharacterized protein n=1 Tax=Xenorhabdus bovienii (strain SS-2004) TaxID=406818 RepID=D3V1V0_XENBS|nr:hypothetical protein XBJ1_2520 [Xenorhabdus bovienii SS-2004]CDH27537.1 hypothetical protein XBJ2_1300088 [Xenorhabdus bovienii str. Jollieti]